MAAAAGEIAVLFFTVVLITGSVYAKVIWGAWWVWELRLTLTLLLWFLGVGYLVMRGAIEDPLMRARFCAVLGIMQVAADSVRASERVLRAGPHASDAGRAQAGSAVAAGGDADHVRARDRRVPAACRPR